MSRINDQQQAQPTKGVTNFNAPAEEVAESLQSASSYSQKVRERQAAMEAARNRGKPLGGAPPIQAGKLSALVAGQGMIRPAFDEGEPPDESYVPPLRTPIQVQQPPPQMGGVGSAYAFNQEMAKGMVDAPRTLAQAKRETGGQQKRAGLSPETQQLLRAQAQANQQGGAMPEVPSEDEEPVPGSRKEGLEDSEKEIAEGNKQEVPALPSMDFASMTALRDELSSKERRDAIEARLEPLRIEDLITKRGVQQDVQVIPGRLSYTLKTLSENEFMFCMQHVYENPGSGMYVEELFNIAKICCSLVALNGGMLPNHLKNAGKNDEEVVKEQFIKKLKILCSYATPLVADIGVQYHWFVQRVNKLFSLEALKNG